jgi:hypothetical protein
MPSDPEESMNVRERIGCFFLAVGLLLVLLFVIPIVRAFRENPGTVPAEWLGIAALSVSVLWVGLRLYFSARKNQPSRKGVSLAGRLAEKWKSGEGKDEEE